MGAGGKRRRGERGAVTGVGISVVEVGVEAADERDFAVVGVEGAIGTTTSFVFDSTAVAAGAGRHGRAGSECRLRREDGADSVMVAADDVLGVEFALR